jgi:predicted NAD/FAD-binding protein
LPVNQLTTEYWFPLYNNNSFMATYLTIGNADPASSAQVSVYIAGQFMASYTIPVGGRVTPTYDNINNGPVQVISTNHVNIIASERAYRNVADLTDFNEMMGLPVNQLTTEYWFPLYNNNSFMATYLTIGNADPASSAQVSVYIAGQFMASYTIPVGGRVTPTYANLNNGPVQVISTNLKNIIVSERAYRNVANLTDFNEMMGLPVNQLTTEYWFPLYNNNSFMTTYLTIGNAQ